MSSIEEIKAQLLAAVDLLEQGKAAAAKADYEAESATGLVKMAFEGTGRQDFLELADRLTLAQVQAADLMVEFTSVQGAITDAIAMM